MPNLRVPILLALLCACSAPAPKARHRSQRLPLYSVGTAQEQFTDTSRPTPANGTEPEQPERFLPADIWYPALVENDGGETPDAPIDPRGAPYPLVVFVHGSSGLSVQSTFLMHSLAAKGYVVVAANHPLTYLLQPGGSSDKRCDLQVGDVSFIADQMFALSARPGSEIADALDPVAGFAVAGHSTGGSVALAAAYAPKNHDGRVKAIVALAPDACFFSEAFFHTRSVPLLVIAGTDDGYVPPIGNGIKAYNLALQPKRLALLTGGMHVFFTDINMRDGNDPPDSNTSDITLAFEEAVGSQGDCSNQGGLGEDPVMPFETQHLLTNQLSTAFLDAYQYEDPSSLNAIDQAPPALVDWRK